MVTKDQVCGAGGKVLIRKSPRTRSKTFPNASLSTKNFTWTVDVSNRRLRIEKPTTDLLNNGMDSLCAVVSLSSSCYLLFGLLDGLFILQMLGSIM